MYEQTNLETFGKITTQVLGKPLALPDLDSIAKLEMIMRCRSMEIEDLEGSLSDAHDKTYLAVEKEYEQAEKGSQAQKDLSNAEKREIEVGRRLKKDSKYMDAAVKCSKLKNERAIMELTRDSLKRAHERNCFGKELKHT
jgi:hypothetical protein